MKDKAKEDFNEWIKENFDSVKYAKLFINAFEDAYLCLSEIENEQKRNETAYKFIEHINNYIQEKKIRDIETSNRRLNTIINRVKIGVDVGFVDCMELITKNRQRTEKATEKRKEYNAQKKYNSAAERVDAILGIKEN